LVGEEEDSMTLGQIKDKYDFFWVFVEKYDSWRLGRLTGEAARFPVIFGGGLWVIHPDISDDWKAEGIDMPKHPRSEIVPK
jgi:hypothetical protein